MLNFGHGWHVAISAFVMFLVAAPAGVMAQTRGVAVSRPEITQPVTVQPQLTLNTNALALQTFRSGYERAFVEWAKETAEREDADGRYIMSVLNGYRRKYCRGKFNERAYACLAAHVGVPQIAFGPSFASTIYYFNSYFSSSVGAPALAIDQGESRVVTKTYADLFDEEIRLTELSFGNPGRIAWAAPFPKYSSEVRAKILADANEARYITSDTSELENAERSLRVKLAVEQGKREVINAYKDNVAALIYRGLVRKPASYTSLMTFLAAREGARQREAGAARLVIPQVTLNGRVRVNIPELVRPGLTLPQTQDREAEVTPPAPVPTAEEPPINPGCAPQDQDCLKRLVLIPSLLEKAGITLSYDPNGGAPYELRGVYTYEGEELNWVGKFEEHFSYIAHLSDRGDVERVEDRVGDKIQVMSLRQIPFRMLKDSALNFNDTMALAFRDGERANYVIKQDLISCVNDELFIIPAGFITDFMSVSQGVRMIFPEGAETPEREWGAALLHDWLYAISERESEEHQDYAQERFVADLKLADMPRARRSAFAWATGSGFSLPAVGRPGELRFATRDSCERGVAYKGNPENARVGNESCDGLFDNAIRYMNILSDYTDMEKIEDDDILGNAQAEAFFAKVVANTDEDVSCDMIE